MARVLAFLPLLTLISCATIISGTHENITVNSSPSGANATLTCATGPVERGATPLTISIRRNAGDCRLSVSKEGFSDETIVIEQGVNKAYWANLTTAPLVLVGVGGIVGVLYSRPDAQSRTWGAACLITAAAAWTIDRWTGAMHEHQPKAVDVALKRKE